MKTLARVSSAILTLVMSIYATAEVEGNESFAGVHFDNLTLQLYAVQQLEAGENAKSICFSSTETVMLNRRTVQKVPKDCAFAKLDFHREKNEWEGKAVNYNLLLEIIGVDIHPIESMRFYFAQNDARLTSATLARYSCGDESLTRYIPGCEWAKISFSNRSAFQGEGVSGDFRSQAPWKKYSVNFSKGREK